MPFSVALPETGSSIAPSVSTFVFAPGVRSATEGPAAEIAAHRDTLAAHYLGAHPVA